MRSGDREGRGHAVPMAGISAIHGEPVLWPSPIAAVKAFSLVVITLARARRPGWLNAQSDWPEWC